MLTITDYDAILFPTSYIKDDEEEENKYHI
jgi:hypothetical protein